ncbi:DNA-directed RNA polymerase III subunit rpc3 [Histomonas meleagridis]|uniref:DNA-directed RNA polymerase III subunit rpc3 n=1 Tax=Histomonas meleagridis TaxID=135588 RepID=UPI003559C002|nr:DNA-directed RNA polymerase III subunit rpc3 [Histomonas meleagridis]KAH0801374.1 DNA-directed RNA polymerase III subunit rpc3 [Histomonas meleagridis]
MSLAGAKHRLIIDVIKMLFGEPASIIASSISEFGPCPLGFISKVTKIPLVDTKTIILSLYVHGIVTVSQDGPRQYISINSLPALILSAPSILLEQIDAVYKKPEYNDVVKTVLLNGIIEIIPNEELRSRKNRHHLTPIQINATPEFIEASNELFKRGLLMRRVIESSTFNTDDVFSLHRRIENINLSKKKTTPTVDPNASGASVSAPLEQAYTLTLNWGSVCSFLRGRYIVQLSQSIFKNNHTELVEGILDVTNASDYSQFQRSMKKNDDDLRGEIVGVPRLEYQRLMAVISVDKREQLFDDLDEIAASQLYLLKPGDGSYWDVTTAKSIRNAQLLYVEAFLEQCISPYHRRCFNYLRSLGVADTHQVETGALLSEKDARSSMFTLARLGFAQMQMVPRNSADKTINTKSIFVWRYDESAVIKAYTTIIGEHARKFLAKIMALHEEYEANEQAAVGNLTATKANEKKEKYLCCYNVAYIDALRVFILFSEM